VFVKRVALGFLMKIDVVLKRVHKLEISFHKSLVILLELLNRLVQGSILQ